LSASGPYPLDEPFEEYALDVYDPTGVTLKRTLEITSIGTGSSTLRDPWVTYEVADQIADGYTPGPTETYWIAVRQNGTYGYSATLRREI
jgi:hypothetical protein